MLRFLQPGRALPLAAAWIFAAAAWGGQTVDGRIVNAANGTGIARANVLLGGEGQGLYRAVTDADGRFRIENVAEGRYFPTYRARGFWTLPFTLDPHGLPPISVSSKGDLVHLEVRMQAVPKISGRVLDAEGKPVANAAIWALQTSTGCAEPMCFGLRATVKANEKGEYSLDTFDAPGTWLVSAIAPESLDPPPPSGGRALGWAQTFYPNVTDPQLGAQLPVRGGADLSSIDIKLAAVAVHRIRGKVLDTHGDPAPRVVVMLENGAGPAVRAQTNGSGIFEFPRVADGEWRAATLLQGRDSKPWAGQALRLKDRDSENLELRMAAPFSVHGNVVWAAPEGVASPGDVPDVILAYQGMSGLAPTAIGRPGDDGAVTFEGTYPGPYKLALLQAPPAPFYLDSVRYGAQDATSSLVTILSGDQPLTITFRYGGGTVSGRIENCGGAHVVLLPQEADLRHAGPAFVRDTACGPNGQFEFAGVRPGEYFGLAIPADDDAGWWGALQDDAVLRQAAKITVRANEHTTADIRVIRR